VQFDSALGALEPRPIKYFNAQLNNGSIHASKRMLEAKATFFCHSQILAALQ
jgi:hypothetical protein